MESTFFIAAYIVLCYAFMAMSVDRAPVFWLLLNSACMASKPFLFLAVPLSEEAELGGDTARAGQ